MICQDIIKFQEGELLVKSLEEPDELREAYRLRHKVFSQVLRWVPPSRDEMEVDAYDTCASAIGVFTETGALIALSRVLQAPGPFMLEAEFKSCLSPGYQLRTEKGTAEVTRLAVDPELVGKGLSTRVLLVMLKGLYQWFLSRDIQTCYMVVDRRFLRVLRAIGIPCEPISRPIALPPAGVVSVAAELNLEKFRLEGAQRCPDFVEWMASLSSIHDGSGTLARLIPATVFGSKIASGTGRLHAGFNKSIPAYPELMGTARVA